MRDPVAQLLLLRYPPPADAAAARAAVGCGTHTDWCAGREAGRPAPSAPAPRRLRPRAHATQPPPISPRIPHPCLPSHLPPHPSSGFLTILAQDDVPGLEVMRRRASSAGAGGGAGAAAAAACRGAACASLDAGEGAAADSGDWISAPPLPVALLVNLGDLAEYWSGGVVGWGWRGGGFVGARSVGVTRRDCV
jgi:hypothetical protein